MQAAAHPVQEVTAHEAQPPEPATAERAQPLASTAALYADPAQWPVERVRLLGVWHQAQEAHAILAAGPHWVRVRVGQQVGDHWLGSIHAQEVHLLAGQGTVKVLGLAKATP
jgi:Tfp pilus assembly protein PilP